MILFSQGSSSAGIDCEHLSEKWNTNCDPLQVGVILMVILLFLGMVATEVVYVKVAKTGMIINV